MTQLFDDSSQLRHGLLTDTKARKLSSREFRGKPESVRRLINEALDILHAFGVPMTGTGRRRESMAMAFIAVAGVTTRLGVESPQDRG